MFSLYSDDESEISEKAQKSLITPLPAPPSVGTVAGRQG